MSDENRYPHAREPEPWEWGVRAQWIESGRSVQKTAFALGMERSKVLQALEACRVWKQDSGYDARFALAKRKGFSDSDAELHASQVEDFYRRNRNGQR